MRSLKPILKILIYWYFVTLAVTKEGVLINASCFTCLIIQFSHQLQMFFPSLLKDHTISLLSHKQAQWKGKIMVQ